MSEMPDTGAETPQSAAAKLFDLRVLIGGLFLLYGVMLTVAGLFTSPKELAKAGSSPRGGGSARSSVKSPSRTSPSPTPGPSASSQAKEGDNTRPFGPLNSPERTEVSCPRTVGVPSWGNAGAGACWG